MRKLTIAVDVDDVCANLIAEWLRRYRQYTKDEMYPEDLVEWDMKKQCPATWHDFETPEALDIYSILHERDLYFSVKPIPGALEAITDLRERGHRIVFVSSCVTGSVDAKMDWLIRHGFLPEGSTQRDFVAASDKALIAADVLIDDHVENVEKYPGRALLVTRPHNAKLSTTRERINGLGEALDAIETMFGAKRSGPAVPHGDYHAELQEHTIIPGDLTRTIELPAGTTSVKLLLDETRARMREQEAAMNEALFRPNAEAIEAILNERGVGKRTFATGATRDTDEGKLDYEGFLSPLVLRRFAEFMHKNRYMRDGSVRDSDNWQKGIPLDAYMKSGFRHFMEWWSGHRAGHVDEDALTALLFNVMGYLHETLKARASAPEVAA